LAFEDLCAWKIAESCFQLIALKLDLAK